MLRRPKYSTIDVVEPKEEEEKEEDQCEICVVLESYAT
jgi:hypothetical protein